jgi:sulfoquinovosyltransferase
MILSLPTAIAAFLAAFIFTIVEAFPHHKLGSQHKMRLTLRENLKDSSPNNIPDLTESPPLKILLLVEPTPFTYVSGYANRFKEMLKFLHKAGDKVQILVPDRNPENAPADFMGFPITTVRGFEFPFYKEVTLTMDTKFNTRKLIKEFKPDIVHVSQPSLLVHQAIFWTKKYNIPLLMSYHTHAVEYAKNYVKFPGNIQVANAFLRHCHNQADLSLCTSPQLKDGLEEAGVTTEVDVWMKGINTEVIIVVNVYLT